MASLFHLNLIQLEKDPVFCWSIYEIEVFKNNLTTIPLVYTEVS